MTANIAKLLLHSRKQILTPISCACRRLTQTNSLFHNSAKLFSTDKLEQTVDQKTKSSQNEDLGGSINEKYKLFNDTDAKVVFDVTEELQRISLQEYEEELSYRNPFEGLNVTRGKTGVYEIADLVEFLKKDKAKNIFVAKVPKEWAYVDYIVIVTAKSVRHMNALIEFIRKGYKAKKNENDTIPRTEGGSSQEWKALDMGNIALHILTHDIREKYDLETLWAVGSNYDDITNKKGIIDDYMNSYNTFVEEFEPVEG